MSIRGISVFVVYSGRPQVDMKEITVDGHSAAQEMTLSAFESEAGRIGACAVVNPSLSMHSPSDKFRWRNLPTCVLVPFLVWLMVCTGCLDSVS